ncbi:MAG: hypothetical protein ACI9JT_000204 [Polaribacter sp.]|jgi:hypothetical protein
MKTQKEPWRKKSYEKATLELKLFVVDQIQNGQISTNYAFKKYDIPKTTIDYWIKKYSTLVQQNIGMSTLDEIKKLKERIENTTIAQKVTKQAVSIYNNLRTHFSLGLRKPAEVHLNPNIKYKSYRRNNVNLPELTI